MKQATVKLPSGEYLIQEVLKWVEQVWINEQGYLTWRYAESDNWKEQTATTLPPGSWQLLGADPTNLTEEEAARVMDGYGIDEWRSYMKKPALESLSSLAASLGIEKPFVILKLKNK